MASPAHLPHAICFGVCPCNVPSFQLYSCTVQFVTNSTVMRKSKHRTSNNDLQGSSPPFSVGCVCLACAPWTTHATNASAKAGQPQPLCSYILLLRLHHCERVSVTVPNSLAALVRALQSASARKSPLLSECGFLWGAMPACICMCCPIKHCQSEIRHPLQGRISEPT